MTGPNCEKRSRLSARLNLQRHGNPLTLHMLGRPRNVPCSQIVRWPILHSQFQLCAQVKYTKGRNDGTGVYQTIYFESTLLGLSSTEFSLIRLSFMHPRLKTYIIRSTCLDR